MRNLPASPEVSLAMMGAVLDGLMPLWPEAAEEEAVEVITRFVYRALNGEDCPPPSHQRLT